MLLCGSVWFVHWLCDYWIFYKHITSSYFFRITQKCSCSKSFTQKLATRLMVSGPSYDRFWCCCIRMHNCCLCDASMNKQMKKKPYNLCRGIKLTVSLHLPQTLLHVMFWLMGNSRKLFHGCTITCVLLGSSFFFFFFFSCVDMCWNMCWWSCFDLVKFSHHTENHSVKLH